MASHWAVSVNDSRHAILAFIRSFRSELYMLPPAQTYLTTALTLIEQHALHRQHLDWPTIRVAAAQRAAHARHAADTYDTIRWVLTQLGEAHSFFAIPDQGYTAIASGSYDREVSKPTARLRPDRIGYLHVPGFRGSANHVTDYARTLQTQIAQLDIHAPVGWIVDLTDNGGGNMWPMVAGLGPLLAESPLGAFPFPDQLPVPWFYAAGRAGVGDTCLADTMTGGYHLHSPDMPVAVLTSARLPALAKRWFSPFVAAPRPAGLVCPPVGSPPQTKGSTCRMEPQSASRWQHLWVGLGGATMTRSNQTRWSRGQVPLSRPQQPRGFTPQH